MDSPTLKEKVLTVWSSIYNTKQSSIFLFKCKNKKIIYMGVQINVCFLFREKKAILVTGNPNLRQVVWLEIGSSLWPYHPERA